MQTRDRSRGRFSRDDEAGFAMIVAVMMTVIGLVMVSTILAVGVHLDSSTVRERKWQLALQVAEAGVEDALAQLDATADLSYVGETTPYEVPGGEVATKVTALSEGGYQIDALGYVPSATSANRLQRRIRVTFQPGPSFKYALYSDAGLFVKSSGGVFGDVYAKSDVEIYNGTTVYGSVTSATGSVFMNQGSRVRPGTDGKPVNVYSGGFTTTGSSSWALRLDNNAELLGSAYLRVANDSACSSVPNSYNLDSGGTAQITGTVYLPGGQLSGSPPAGGLVAHCEVRPDAADEMPSFTYQPNAYPSILEVNPATFSTFTSLSGEMYVTGGQDEEIDLSCKTITGDFVLITEVEIKKSNTCGSTAFFSGSSDSIVQIISLNDGDASDPAIDVENSLSLPSPSPAVLIYSEGFCDLKNSVITVGAVYCNGINIKNDLTITYDERIRRLIGFGDSLYARTSFQELTSRTPL